MIKDWKDEKFLIDEEHFLEKMEGEVHTWREECLKEGYFSSYDRSKIHYVYAINPEEKGSIVMSHGFCEFYGKFYEVMYYFYQAGYSVFFVEHRGHGFSQRFVEELDKVYVKSYDEYVEDFKCFMDQVVTKESLAKEYYLYCHSMGGAIGTLFLEKYPTYFKKAVLSSPMHQMNFGSVPKWQVVLLMFVSRFLPWEEKYVPGQTGFDNVNVFPTSGCLSEARYNYIFKQRQDIPEFSSYGGTYAWTRASIKATKQVVKDAAKVQIPVLLFQAGRDTMVEPEGQNIFAKESGNTTLVKVPESKHEIFNATEDIRRDYYHKIFTFFESK